MKTKKVAVIGMLVAVAFVLSYIEAMLPLNIGIPGVKAGLSNIVVVFCLYRLSVGETFGIAIIRIVLCGLTFGSLSAMLYSLAGGILSFVVMLLLKKTEKFSVYGVSVAGGAAHNIGQICVAIIVLKTKLLIYYLPLLLISGTIAGIIVGILGAVLIKRLKGVSL